VTLGEVDRTARRLRLSGGGRTRGETHSSFFISTKFLPPVGIIVPIYIIMRDLQLLDNLRALVLEEAQAQLPPKPPGHIRL